MPGSEPISKAGAPSPEPAYLGGVVFVGGLEDPGRASSWCGLRPSATRNRTAEIFLELRAMIDRLRSQPGHACQDTPGL
jgi:hypothetical protein